MRPYTFLAIGLIILLAAMTVSATGITATHISGTIYQFSAPGAVGDIRWSFGDGASSEELSPVHEFPIGEFTVRAEDSQGGVFSVVVDTRPPVIDTVNNTVNVGVISVPGGLLLLSSTLMFCLARTGQHPLSDLLGRNGKNLVQLLYFVGILVGGLLVFNSMYPNGGI